jgi:hypothetical protein
MSTRSLPRPQEQAAESGDEQFDSYRTVLTELLAHHRRLAESTGDVRCACGAPAPCPCEQLAAQLLDWV